MSSKIPRIERAGQPADTAPEGGEARDDREQPLQGEGNYAAARRHRESVEGFVESGRVEPAARDAEPQDAQQADELKRAEEEGRRHARR